MPATGNTGFAPGSQTLSAPWMGTAYNQYIQPWLQPGRGGFGKPFTPLGARAASAEEQNGGGTNLPPDAGARPYGTRATLNNRPVVWAGKDYGWQSPKTGSATMDALNAPGAQDRFIQDRTNLGRTSVPLGGGAPTPIIQHADDEYNRLISQYGPSGIQQLAGMTSLPTGFTPTGSNKPASLKDYYGAQTLQGSANLGSIISEMGYKGDMAKWAQANPMLAQREYDKRFGGATLASSVHPDGSVRGMPQAIAGLDTSKMMPTAAMQGTVFPGQGQGPTFNPAAFTDKSDFGTPANAVPAPPMQQGRAVSAPYDKAQAMAAQKTAGATGMPNFETTPEAQAPGKTWLGKVLSSPWGQSLMNTGGAMGIDYMQGIR